MSDVAQQHRAHILRLLADSGVSDREFVVPQKKPSSQPATNPYVAPPDATTHWVRSSIVDEARGLVATENLPLNITMEWSISAEHGFLVSARWGDGPTQAVTYKLFMTDDMEEEIENGRFSNDDFKTIRDVVADLLEELDPEHTLRAEEQESTFQVKVEDTKTPRRNVSELLIQYQTARGFVRLSEPEQAREVTRHVAQRAEAQAADRMNGVTRRTSKRLRWRKEPEASLSPLVMVVKSRK